MIDCTEQLLIDANEALIVRGELDRIEQFFTADYIARSGRKGGEGHEDRSSEPNGRHRDLSADSTWNGLLRIAWSQT